MRHILAFILAFVLILPHAKAQPVSITDTDAEAYIYNRIITDPTEIYRLHAWYAGLKNLNLWSSIVLMASYSSRDNALSGSTIVSMVGGNGTINGTVPQTTNGLTFTGNTANFVQYANPLQSTAVAAFTIFSGFDSTVHNGAHATLIGGNDNSSARGINIYLNGSPQAGAQATSLYGYYSSDGTGAGQPGDIISGDGLAATKAVTSGPQTLSWSFSASLRTIFAGFNMPGFSSGSFGTAWNNAATWNLGRMATAASPLNGNVNLILVLNKALTFAEHQALRRLYAKTLGWEYLPKVNMIFEGDSLVQGAAGEFTFPCHLWTNATYKTVVQTKNIGLSGDFASTMITEYPTSAAPYRIEFDFAPRQYLHLMAGGNDLAGVTTGMQAFNYLKSTWKLARADGFIVVAYTYPKSLNFNSNAQQEAYRQEMNDQIRAATGLWDYLVDVDRIRALDNADTAALGSLNPTYQNDRVHFTSYGHFLISREVARVINNP